MNPVRKNKIVLADYDYLKDIKNRLLLAEMSLFEVAVINEVLNTSIKIPIAKLITSIGCEREELLEALSKFETTGLLAVENNMVLVDKDMRKYYELQLAKFDEDFKPDMEFLQSLLRKVPIHILPAWYSIPRASNNIFESLLEKYLQTPRIFQRYLMELHVGEPLMTNIVDDVYHAPNFEISSDALRKKHNLTKEEFEETLLYLEFNFVCCLCYRKEEGSWKEIVTPFHEWKEYLRFVSEGRPKPIEKTEEIVLNSHSGFAIIADMSAVLAAAKSAPLSMEQSKKNVSSLTATAVKALAGQCPSMPACTKANLDEHQQYLSSIARKLCLIHLAENCKDRLSPLPQAVEWLNLPTEDRALFIHRHPYNKVIDSEVDPELNTEKNLREVEKSLEGLSRVGWIYFDDYLKGLSAPIGHTEPISLVKKGRRWQYKIPQYNEKEKQYVKAVLFERLFQAGLVAIGTHQGKDCFSVTPFGHTVLNPR